MINVYVNVGHYMHALDNCNITSKGSSKMLFQNIKASGDGGVLHINVNNAIIFQQ